MPDLSKVDRNAKVIALLLVVEALLPAFSGRYTSLLVNLVIIGLPAIGVWKGIRLAFVVQVALAVLSFFSLLVIAISYGARAPVTLPFTMVLVAVTGGYCALRLRNWQVDPHAPPHRFQSVRPTTIILALLLIGMVVTLFRQPSAPGPIESRKPLESIRK